MKIVIQRVNTARVDVAGQCVGKIGHGLLVLCGFSQQDDAEQLDWTARKLLQLRIFDDENGQMNLALGDVGGELLVVSQFTLYASTKKGNRPSFVAAAKPAAAKALYEQWLEKLHTLSGKKPESGIFGADMQISLVNNGPVTLLIDSENRV